MEDTVEVMIAPERILKLTATPRDLFVVISALKERGFDPHVRVVDKEIGGWTCWQPTKEAA
jgi:hypothetical protein